MVDQGGCNGVTVAGHRYVGLSVAISGVMVVSVEWWW